MTKQHIVWVREQLRRTPDAVLKEALQRYEYLAMNGGSRRLLEEVESYIADRMQMLMNLH